MLLNQEEHTFLVGLKQMVNLLYGFPDAKIYGYPTDSDIIRLVL